MTTADIVVLRFGARRVPRALSGLTVHELVAATELDPGDTRRLIVLGTHADLSTVLTRLLRLDRLDVEVGFVPRRWAARRARTAAAQRVPLIRDETGTVVVQAAVWLPADDVIEGEAIVDDTVLFDGTATGVRIEPLVGPPGLRARVLGPGRHRWVTGRAAQLGTTGALVERDGMPGPRPVKRSTFYRHTTGWLAVR